MSVKDPQGTVSLGQGSQFVGLEARQEQYFSTSPNSPDVRRTIRVQLAGREVAAEVSHGVFSGNRLDLGTSVLLRRAPKPPTHGDLLDLGCGWGPIALTLGLLSPAATVWAVDVNRRALELTRDNAGSQQLINIHAVEPDEVPDETLFDAIWSNPPIRVGKEALHELLMRWLPRLSGHGAAYLVVQRNLGADSLIPWLAQALGGGYAVSKYASAKGYRVIEVVRQA
ncbi:class I SAM-dependent methyltransferase [Bifidobacterium sp.]|jgi:16S rRNA G1207 methylase RsmC|uniref:class I SAM-dependent methyltransferase n=1 Tax=Bifidobacterium sp. TaxID=41200 RepID=UPI0025BEA7AE|nr:methyltransferase [Bifidobacterium sp.]MCH4209280.1 class I SAM-dependent methyltransferase [Bifidobacterium sp.]MCI1224074.1 class I SAM-dependent methyltransferase [Bifidobacterium sp.]